MWDRDGGERGLFSGAHARPFFGFEVPRGTPDPSPLVVKLVAGAANSGERDGEEHWRPKSHQKDPKDVG